MLIMMYRSLLAFVAVSSAQVATADAQSVYVAPGGMYVASARVVVRPDPYASPYGPPGPVVYGSPGYGVPGPVYGPPPLAAPGPIYGPPVVAAPEPLYPPPPVVTPGPVSVYGATAPVYGPSAVYGPAPVYLDEEPTYVVSRRAIAAPSAYAREAAPRPPAAVPYGRGDRCVVTLADGRRAYCN
jgi:hypothetical protein